MVSDLFCLICREDDHDFLSRCNHSYHLECLSAWFQIRNGECPLCRGPISQIQLLEDIIAKRISFDSLFLIKSGSLEFFDKRVGKWMFEFKIKYILDELLSRGTDLDIPAVELEQHGAFKAFLENEIVKSSDRKAGETGRLDIIKYFVDKKAERNYLVRAVAAAAFNGHFEIVKYLAENRFHTNITVFIAVQGGRLEIMKYLLGIRTDKPKKASLDHLMKHAITFGHLHILKYLVGQGVANPKAMLLAAAKGHLDMVKYLTERGQSCRNGAIDAAALAGHLEIVKYLMKHGHNNCSLEIVDKSAQLGRSEVVKYLVGLGKPYSEEAFESGYRNNNFEIVQCLIDNGHPYSPEALNYALQRGFSTIVQYLLEKGKPRTF